MITVWQKMSDRWKLQVAATKNAKERKDHVVANYEYKVRMAATEALRRNNCAAQPVREKIELPVLKLYAKMRAMAFGEILK